MIQKDIVTIYTEEITYSYDDVPIDDFLEIVQRNKSAGATMVEIESPSDYSDVTIAFYFRREETDAEFVERQKRVKENEKSKRFYQIQEYERLKKELGL